MRGENGNGAKKLIPEGVITVRVAIDEQSYAMRGRGCFSHLLKHVPRKVKIEECVDQYRCAAVGYETSVASTPSPLILQIGPVPISEIDQISLAHPRCP